LTPAFPGKGLKWALKIGVAMSLIGYFSDLRKWLPSVFVAVERKPSSILETLGSSKNIDIYICLEKNTSLL
jgi:hypothetical protein